MTFTDWFVSAVQGLRHQIQPNLHTFTQSCSLIKLYVHKCNSVQYLWGKLWSQSLKLRHCHNPVMTRTSNLQIIKQELETKTFFFNPQLQTLHWLQQNGLFKRKVTHSVQTAREHGIRRQQSGRLVTDFRHWFCVFFWPAAPQRVDVQLQLWPSDVDTEVLGLRFEQKKEDVTHIDIHFSPFLQRHTALKIHWLRSSARWNLREEHKIN